MAYIGRGINSGDAVSDHLTGSGATVYTLTYDTTTDGVVLSLDGVVQRNGTDFTILGTQLTFTSAVASPIAIQVIYTGLTLAIGTPGTGTVGVSQLSSTGTASSSTYLRGDNSWATIADEITKSGSDPTASTNPAGGVGTVFLNTTSGEMYSCTDATAGANIWTNVGDGTGQQPITYFSATGGTITTDGNYKVHTFNSSGTFAATIGNAPSVGALANYLVIAGGASGGYGGGGAGGLRSTVTATGGGGSLESALTLTTQSYTVTIGGGGASSGGGGAIGNSGSNSVFSTITSIGGGGGGGGSADALSGGSGGGSGITSSYDNGGAGTANQGYAGATNTFFGDPHLVSGGGGGAGAVGVAPANNNTGGAGGAGVATSITGSSVTLAGGGGGGAVRAGGVPGAGGTGGGGAAGQEASTNGVSATVNTGSGGGGRSQNTVPGAGGSGVVIIRYQFQA